MTTKPRSVSQPNLTALAAIHDRISWFLAVRELKRRDQELKAKTKKRVTRKSRISA